MEWYEKEGKPFESVSWDDLFQSEPFSTQSSSEGQQSQSSRKNADAHSYTQEEKHTQGDSSWQSAPNVENIPTSGRFRSGDQVNRIDRKVYLFHLCGRTVNHEHGKDWESKGICELCGEVNPYWFLKIYGNSLAGRNYPEVMRRHASGRAKVTWQQWCKLREIIGA